MKRRLLKKLFAIATLVMNAHWAFAEAYLFDPQGLSPVPTVLIHTEAKIVRGQWTTQPGSAGTQLETIGSGPLPNGLSGSRVEWEGPLVQRQKRYRVAVSWRAIASHPNLSKNVRFEIGMRAGSTYSVLTAANVEQSRQPSNFFTREKCTAGLCTAVWNTLGEVTPKLPIGDVLSRPRLVISLVVPQGVVGAADRVRVEEITDDFRVSDNGAKSLYSTWYPPTDVFVPASGSYEYFMYTANGSSMHIQKNPGKVGSWFLGNVAPGKYRVVASWPYSSTAAGSAIYKVSAEGRRVEARPMNQRLTPSDFCRRGATWNYLRDASGNPLEIEIVNNKVVEVSLEGDRNTIADAVALIAPGSTLKDDFEAAYINGVQYDTLWQPIIDNYNTGIAPYMRSGTLAATTKIAQAATNLFPMDLYSREYIPQDSTISVEVSLGGGRLNRRRIAGVRGRVVPASKGPNDYRYYEAAIYCDGECSLYLAYGETFRPWLQKTIARTVLSPSQLKSLQGADSDRLALSAKGNVLSVYLNGQLIQQEIDDTILPSPGRYGIFVDSSATTLLKQLHVE